MSNKRRSTTGVGSRHGGMGISKHRKSGRTPKSPRIRFLQKMDAEEESTPPKKHKQKMFGSITALMKTRK